ncbi:MAG TPA: VWA domain-containing protein [Actinomycetes bacterium]
MSAAVSASAGAETVLDTLVGFARTLRAAGVAAGPDRVQAMVEALGELDVCRRDDVYWAGRLTLCSGPDDLPRYGAAFTAWFGGEVPPPMRPVPRTEVRREVAMPVDASAGDRPGTDPSRAATASPAEVLRHRDVARLTPAERDEVRRMIALLRSPAPLRPSRRLVPDRHGLLDPRRTVRAMLERGGEPARLRRQHRTQRARRVVLLVDVSGSMAPYADTVLRFAHACVRQRPRTEAFTIGTRLTRVTREMAATDPDAAMTAVSSVVPDWSGGTRLGEELKAFLDRYGQRGAARGAVVVVASDGWERGDPTLLGEQMHRLHRLAHRVVWVNPHMAREGFAPITAGMATALPWVDDFVEGHSLAAFERLGALISQGGSVDA